LNENFVTLVKKQPLKVVVHLLGTNKAHKKATECQFGGFAVTVFKENNNILFRLKQ